jgi:glycosyltransferase involved in cell wall biosynthesis
MKVAIFTDNDFEKVNGVTTTLRAVLEHAPPGISARVYTASRRDADDPKYFSLASPGLPIPFYREMRMYLPRVGAFLRAAIADAVDIIHLTTPGPIGLAAMRIARQLRVPLVGSFHTDLAAYARILSGSDRLGTVIGEFMRWPYGRCARVFAPSEATRQLLMRSPADADRIDVWRRGVDSAHFTPTRRSDALRRRWGVSDARPALAYVGRVSREKGLHLLPEVQTVLYRLGLPHRFVIVGQGPMLAELRDRLPDAIFTGVLDRDEIAVAYASSDVFIFPSRTDTAGNVVLEAQASGLPVLVSDAGGPQENLARERSGHVIADLDPTSWVAALTPLLRDAARRRAMAAAARAYGESRTWSLALDPLYRGYQELAGASAQTAPSRSVCSGDTAPLPAPRILRRVGSGAPDVGGRASRSRT